MQVGGEEGIGPGFFNDTRRLAVDGEGNIYTGDYSGGRIQVFDAAGNFLATWNAGTELYMGGMTVDHGGTVYIVNIDTVEKYNGMTGEFLGTLALPGNQRTYFKTIATGPDGNVYLVADDRLIRLDNNGNVALDLDEPFANIPDFATTQDDIAIDGAGNIYILGRETVYKLNAQGQFVDQIGSKGDGEDQFFSTPTSLAVDGKGRIYADDFYGIKVFEGTGRYLATIDSPGVAFDMLVTKENDLLVMDRNGNEIRKYRLNQ
jgi:sugar lactone lactonase YvrE